jgi:hypothetical protein
MGVIKMKTQDVIDLALASGLYQDGDMFFSPTTGDADVHISDLEYFAKTVEERSLSRQKASYYQEGYEAGLDIKSKLMQDAMYLLGAWERGAEADDYVMDLWHLRQKFDVYAKSQNVNTSGEYVHTNDIKPWVGLTDDDIDWILGLAYADDIELIKTIETKLKDKNG